GRNDVKVINMINGGRNHKRLYEGERSSLTEELTFLAVPRYSLTDEPIILEGMIEGHQVRRIHVDSGSSSKIMYEHCFKNLGANIWSRLRKCRSPLVGFSGQTYHPLGVINLRITMCKAGRSKTVLMKFTIVKCHSPYNVLIRRTRMRSLGAEALWECRQLEKTRNSWKETQWHQHKEQMSRIQEQTILRARDNPGRRLGKDPMLPEKERREGLGGTTLPQFVMEH
ncbi:reverse transcriptase domain-containing protein, partial [Tanacetum coccineum]